MDSERQQTIRQNIAIVFFILNLAATDREHIIQEIALYLHAHFHPSNEECLTPQGGANAVGDEGFCP
jgi:hypothetical protein